MALNSQKYFQILPNLLSNHSCYWNLSVASVASAIACGARDPGNTILTADSIVSARRIYLVLCSSKFPASLPILLNISTTRLFISLMVLFLIDFVGSTALNTV